MIEHRDASKNRHSGEPAKPESSGLVRIIRFELVALTIFSEDGQKRQRNSYQLAISDSLDPKKVNLIQVAKSAILHGTEPGIHCLGVVIVKSDQDIPSIHARPVAQIHNLTLPP